MGHRSKPRVTVAFNGFAPHQSQPARPRPALGRSCRSSAWARRRCGGARRGGGCPCSAFLLAAPCWASPCQQASERRRRLANAIAAAQSVTALASTADSLVAPPKLRREARVHKTSLWLFLGKPRPRRWKRLLAQCGLELLTGRSRTLTHAECRRVMEVYFRQVGERRLRALSGAGRRPARSR